MNEEAVTGFEHAWLPISSVAELLYCPRNFYFRVVEAAQDSNVAVEAGKQEEEWRNQRQVLVDREGLKWRQVSVASERLGLIGVVDTVAVAEEIVPIEFKHGILRTNLHDHVQVAAQGIALEEVLGTAVNTGYLYYVGSRQRVRISIDDALRDQVVAAVNQARSILEAGVIPEPVADVRCSGCSLFDRCQPFEVQELKGKPVDKGSRPLPRVRLDRVLVLDQYGGTLRKSGQQLVAQNGDQVVARIPAAQLDEVLVLGNVAVTGAALRLLAETQKRVSIMTGQGRWLGTLTPMATGNIHVRVAQFETWQREERRLAIAQGVVSGKIHNMRVLLRRQGRAHDGATRDLARSQKLIQTADGIDTLLGIEGNASRVYFGALKDLFEPAWDFDGRNRRPPRDPINALLSFGYALLAKDLTYLIGMVGLDPWLGLYHGIKYGRPGLALDLMEEFRSVIVDATVLTLVHRRVIVPDDFSQQFGSVRLSDKARRRFVDAYQDRKAQIVRHPLFGYRVSYFRIMETQVRLLGKVLTGELDRYRAFLWR